MDPMLTIEPPSVPISFTASWVVKIRPITFSSNCFPDVFRGVSFERRELINTGIVHEYIHPAVCFPRLHEKTLDVGEPGNIRLHRNGVSSCLSDAGYYCIRAAPAACIIHYHRSTFCCQVLRYRGSDSLRRSRYDCDFNP